MRWQASCVSTLAIVACTVRAEPAPTSASAAESTPSTVASTEEDSDKPWWSLGGASLFTGLGIAPESGVFSLGRWHGLVDLRVAGNMQETRSEGLADQKFYSYLTSQGLTVRNDSWSVLDPRLLTGSASVRFGFQQARQDAQDQGVSQNGDVTDYYLNMTFLQEKPYNLNLQAAHREYVTSIAGGGTTSSANSLRGATLRLREASILREKEIAPYFSASLFGGQEDIDETTTNAGRQFRREEQRDRIEFEAHNGFETADLNLNVQFVDVRNQIFPESSFRNKNADLRYSLDFGQNLNRHSNTHFNYSERTGQFSTTVLDLDQYLFVEHNTFLSSSLYYAMQDVDAEDASSTSQRVDGGVQYQPFLNVSTSVGLSAGRVDYDTGVVDSHGGTAGLNYNHWLPADGVLTLTANGGLQFSDSQLSSGEVPVVDARYQAPPQLGAGAGFLLNETDVLTDTIVIFNVRGGARLPTTIGIDYEVEVEGNRTRIVPLVTSTVIQGGDPLDISYTYLTDPNLRSRIRNQAYAMTANYDWIVLSLTHDIVEQDPLSGQEQTLLSDQKRSALRVDVRKEWGYWRAIGNARGARYRDERLNYDEIRLSENLSWQPYYDWQLSFDASQTRSRFVDTGRVSDYFDARLGGTWHSKQGWWTDGYLNWRKQAETETENETIVEGFIRVRRNWPQLAFSMSMGLGQRDRGSVRSFYQNLQIYVTRTF